MNGTAPERGGHWLASDGRWYPLALHPDPSRRPGWWLAADGRWYPPQPPAAPLPRRGRSRKGWAVGVAALLALVLIGELGDDEQESRLASRSGTTTTTAAVAGASAETTAEPSTTTSPPTTATTSAPETTTSTTAPFGDLTTVGSITDGDTFRTADGVRVRLIGIDTPERGACYFAEASAHLAALIPVGTSIRLDYDVDRLDRYGRTLAYVYRASDGLFVNAAMARDGYAQQLTVPPNVAHAEEFRSAVAQARDAGVGLWSGCQPEVAVATTTTAAPRPAPTSTTVPSPKAACHPSYRGTCIPPDVSDADCAGGGGNGPYYVQEKNIQVVGPDVFGLDGNNDGVGCEPR